LVTVVDQITDRKTKGACMKKQTAKTKKVAKQKPVMPTVNFSVMYGGKL
jgi:hypothetical protein